MIGKAGVPYWRLSGFYFLFFSTVGVLLPFWTLYLKSSGFDAKQIGILSAILVLPKVFVTYFWGWVVDHSGQRIRIIKLASFLSVLTFSAVLFIHGFWGLAITLFIFSLFWSGPLPQVEAATLGHLGESVHTYTVVRVWGSVGFILTVWLLGLVFEFLSISYVPHIIIIFILLMWFLTLSLPEQEMTEHPHIYKNFIQIFRTPGVIAFLIVCFLMLVSHGPYYTFFSIYLEERGYNSTLIGQLWALGVIAEVVLFLGMHLLHKYFSLKQLMLTSLFLAFIRWLLIGYYVENILLLLIAQLLHAATFGIYHAVAIQYVHKIFRGRLQGRGQALYSSVSFGAGMAAGSFISGYIWQTWGAVACFNFGTLTALLAFFIAMGWMNNKIEE